MSGERRRLARSPRSRRRERSEEAAAARSTGPRHEAPTCPQLSGPPGELGSHPPGSGLRGPRDAALGGRAPAPPARPRRAPGKEFAWPSLRLAAQVAGAKGDPRRGENREWRRRRRVRRGSHPWPSRLPVPPPSLPLPDRRGRTRKKKKKKEKGVGELDVKIGCGGWWKIVGLSSSVFGEAAAAGGEAAPAPTAAC